jgi:hypothetical protein
MPKNRKSDRYYGSDLNKFIDEFCSREMTCINIDCLLVKIKDKRIRFIESKHSIEGMPHSQLTALKILKRIFESKNNTPWRVEFYVVRGDYPYDEDVEIQEIGSSKVYQPTQQELIKWLNFELELEQIPPPKQLGWLMPSTLNCQGGLADD